MSHLITLDQPWQIECARLASAKAAIKLEAAGMRHSRLGSLRRRWAVHLGLSPNAKHETVIKLLEEKIQKIKETHSEQQSPQS